MCNSRLRLSLGDTLFDGLDGQPFVEEGRKEVSKCTLAFDKTLALFLGRLLNERCQICKKIMSFLAVPRSIKKTHRASKL